MAVLKTRTKHWQYVAKELSRTVAIEQDPLDLEASENFIVFVERITRHLPPDKQMQVQPHQMLWINQWITEIDTKVLKRIGGDNVNILAPRGSGKSSLLGLFATWAIGYHAKYHLPCQILYISNCLPIARDKSRAIKQIITSSEYQAIFPNVFKGDRFADQMWSIDTNAAGIKVTGTEYFTLMAAGIKGAISSKRCFVAGTSIATLAGCKKVEDIDVGDIVKTFNHGTQKEEYKPVIARDNRPSSNLVQVQTSQGRSFTCTADHRIFVVGQGYKEAYTLLPGDALITSRKSQKCQSALSYLSDNNTKRQLNLSFLLLCFASSPSRIGMRFLSNKIFTNLSQFYATSRGIELCSFLLLSEMFSESQSGHNASPQTLPTMQCSDSKYDFTKEWGLLSGLSGSKTTNQNIITQSLWAMWENVSAESLESAALFFGLCQPNSFNQNDWGWKQPLSKWRMLSQSISRHEKTSLKSRQQLLCGMQYGELADKYAMGCSSEFIGSSPHRSRQTQQQDYEFNYFVPFVSYDPSQITYDTVSSVTSFGNRTEQVYDIEVEGNHNFFANDCLVHNCMLVLYDDLIKSADDIANANVRAQYIRNHRQVISPCLFEGGRIIGIGTRYRPDDVHAKEFIESKGWKVIEQSALVADNEEGELYSYWEEMWSTEYLKGLLEADPLSFSFQYQNKIMNVEGGIRIEPSWIHWDTPPKTFDRLAVGIDFAASETDKACYTAMMLVGQSKDTFWILDYRRGKWVGNCEKIDILLEMIDDWKETTTNCKIFAEAVAYQASFQGDFTSYAINQKRRYDLHVIPSRLQGDKVSHLMSVTGIYANGLVKYNRYIDFSYPISEMTGFQSEAEYSDCLDATVIALQGLGVRPRLSMI